MQLLPLKSTHGTGRDPGKWLHSACVKGLNLYNKLRLLYIYVPKCGASDVHVKVLKQ